MRRLVAVTQEDCGAISLDVTVPVQGSTEAGSGVGTPAVNPRSAAGIWSRAAAEGRTVAATKRLAEPQSLLGDEEERAVADQRSAEDATEIVMLHRLAGQAGTIGEPVVRAQVFIAVVVEQGAVEFVGAGAGAERELAAGHASELGAGWWRYRGGTGRGPPWTRCRACCRWRCKPEACRRATGWLVRQSRTARRYRR